MVRPRTDIRPRILAAARTRFLADGVDGASLRAIARLAGTNIGMIYYYFPTKDDLFAAVVEEVYARIVTDLDASLTVGDDFAREERGALAHSDFATRVRALYQRIARMTDVEADTARLVVREALVSSERLGRLVERFKQGHLALLVRLVGDGQREGALATDVPLPLMAIATGVLGMAPQVILRTIGARSPFGAALAPGDALVEQLVRVLLGGIGKRDGGP